MVLVVAIAVGFSIPRGFADFIYIRREVNASFKIDERTTSSIVVSTGDYMDRATAAAFRPPIKGVVLYWARRLSFWPGPCMAALSLAMLGLGLGQARRLAGRPGMAMAVAVVLAMVVTAIRLPDLLILRTSPPQLHWRGWWLEFWFTVPRLAGFAVAVSWATLALGGRWRAGGGWLDRLGVLLGTIWIAMAMIDLGATWYQALLF
jgi:hypothetical protein